MVQFDEIHTLTATVDGITFASLEARLNDDDTVDGLRSRLVSALGETGTDVDAAFDAAFARCEEIPGNGAAGCAHCGTISIEIRRSIGE